MAGSRLSGASVREPRRWFFADCVFDEANWTLCVAGRRVSAETKPLELLRALLLRAGELVSKHDLLDAIWPDVAVVEASLPTAIGKLRRALDDDRRDPHIIETVPRIGYRLAVPVTVENLSPTGASVASGDGSRSPSGASPARQHSGLFAGIGVLAVGALALAAWLLAPLHAPAPGRRIYSEAEVKNVLRNLDVHAVERMIAAGWDARTLFKEEGADSLSYVLEICEWNPGHDRQKLLMMARTLIEAGASIDRRNVWGDTAYSIAKAPRYCGPTHPVTVMIRRLCASGPTPPGDRCMASYELARGQHFAAEPKPKA